MRFYLNLCFLVPVVLHALAPEPGLQKKSGKSNNFVVIASCLTIENGRKVDKDWFDKNIYNATGKVHENGVVELRYGGGLRSYSVAGGNAKIRLRQAGALFPKAKITEKVGDKEITHVQTAPLFARFINFINNYKRLPYVEIHPLNKSEFCKLDIEIIDDILTANRYLINKRIKDHRFKVFANGNTVYMLLENYMKGGYVCLRFEGVLSKQKRFSKTKQIPLIRMHEEGPFLSYVKTNDKKGALSIQELNNDFDFTGHIGKDKPLAVGRYKYTDKGFSVFAMKNDDIRLLIDGRLVIAENRINMKAEFLGVNGKFLFNELGRYVRGMHSMGFIHGNLKVANIGIDESRIPILRGMTESFQLPVDTTIRERAGWAFVDLAGVIGDFSRMMAHGIETDNHTIKFLEGYFGIPIPNSVIAECVSYEFYRKSLLAQDNQISISEMFPNLYNLLLSIETKEWGLDIEETIDERAFTIDSNYSEHAEWEKNDDDLDDDDWSGGSCGFSTIIKNIDDKLKLMRSVMTNI